MENILFQWLLDLPATFAQFGEWLTTPLPYINYTPLAIIGVTGITAIIGLLALRLVVGG